MTALPREKDTGLVPKWKTLFKVKDKGEKEEEEGDLPCAALERKGEDDGGGEEGRESIKKNWKGRRKRGIIWGECGEEEN